MAHRKLAIFRRQLFTALSVLSLLLCVATMVLWVRSYQRVDAFGFHTTRAARTVTSVRAEVQLMESRQVQAFSSECFPPAPGYRYDCYSSATFLSMVEFIRGYNDADYLSAAYWGFGYSHQIETYGEYRAAWVPHWFLALLFAILPALRLRAAIRSRRRGPHRPLPALRLRPPRHARALPGVRRGGHKSEVSGQRRKGVESSDL